MLLVFLLYNPYTTIRDFCQRIGKINHGIQYIFVDKLFNVKMSTQNIASTEVKESDDYLIELIGLKDDFPEDARNAYGELYNRYWEVMLAIARKFCANSNDCEADAEDLVMDTFNVIYNKKARSFDKSKVNRANIRQSIKSWMKTVMFSVHYDLYIDEITKEQIHIEKKGGNSSQDTITRESYIIPIVSVLNYLEENHEDFIDQLDNSETSEQDIEPSENESGNIELVSNYINNLPEREADIIRDIYTFYVPGKKLPSPLLDTIEKKWGTTRENMRRILKKFRDKIKEELKEKIVYRR